MSDNNNIPKDSPSSFRPKGQLPQAFRQAHGNNHELQNLPPKVKQDYELTKQYAQVRLDEAKRKQQRSHYYRVLKEQDRLKDEYIRNLDAPRPPGIRANRYADISILNSQAKQLIEAQDRSRLSVIAEQNQASLDQVISQYHKDQERIARGQTPAAEHSQPEQER